MLDKYDLIVFWECVIILKHTWIYQSGVHIFIHDKTQHKIPLCFWRKSTRLQRNVILSNSVQVKPLLPPRNSQGSCGENNFIWSYICLSTQYLLPYLCTYRQMSATPWSDLLPCNATVLFTPPLCTPLIHSDLIIHCSLDSI